MKIISLQPPSSNDSFMTMQYGLCIGTLTYAQAFRGYFGMNGLLGWLLWVLMK
jgi:hypothetical protein